MVLKGDVDVPGGWYEAMDSDETFNEKLSVSERSVL